MPDRCTDPTCEQHWPTFADIPTMRDQLAAVWEGDPELTDVEVISHHRAEFAPDERHE